MTRYASKSWRTFRPRTGAAPLAPVQISLIARDCRVLGLDPGSQRTGYGIIDCRGSDERHVASGCVDVIGHDMVVRLQRIYAAVSALVAEHRPDMVAIERVFVHRNPDSALKLGQARGVALCAAASLGASVHEYAPRAIKMAVTEAMAAARRSRRWRRWCVRCCCWRSSSRPMRPMRSRWRCAMRRRVVWARSKRSMSPERWASGP